MRIHNKATYYCNGSIQRDKKKIRDTDIKSNKRYGKQEEVITCIRIIHLLLSSNRCHPIESGYIEFQG